MVETSPFDGLPVSRISPFYSACVSTIASIVKAQPEDIPLFFFCGLHTAPQDTVQGPQGIMRTLIARLLMAGTVPTSTSPTTADICRL